MDRNSDPVLEDSPLSQRITSNGKSVEIQIYRLEGDPLWALEAVDDFGNSTVWDDQFESDGEALQVAQETVNSEGIEVLIGKPSGDNH